MGICWGLLDRHASPWLPAQSCSLHVLHGAGKIKMRRTQGPAQPALVGAGSLVTQQQTGSLSQTDHAGGLTLEMPSAVAAAAGVISI